MSDLAGLTALILAGGLGTRLRAVLSDRPKPMAEVAARPFITFLLDQLAEAGVQHAVLCTGFLGEEVRRQLGARYRTLELEYSQESEPMGTAGALRQALPCCRSKTALAMNGDSFFGVDLKAFWAWHESQGFEASLALTEMADTSRYGRVMLGPSDRIVAFEEKAASAGPGWINAGIYLMATGLLQSLPQHRPLSLEHDAFPSWIGRLHGFPASGPFLDIGTPESYASAEAFFQQGKHCQ
jgi:NDP-sugar pyrophosphorylase family protein